MKEVSGRVIKMKEVKKDRHFFAGEGLWRELKIAAMKQSITISDLVTIFCRDGLKDNKRGLI